MAEFDLDAARQNFAELTGLFEDAALVASEGQGISGLDDGRRHFKRMAKTMLRIHERLIILEGHLQ